MLGDPAYYGRLGFDAGLAAGFANPYAGPHFMVKPLAGKNSRPIKGLWVTPRRSPGCGLSAGFPRAKSL